MNKYFFILGINPGLSVAEIVSWLQNNGLEYKIILAKQDFLIVEVGGELPRNILYKLGGTIKYGQVIAETRGSSVSQDFLINIIKPVSGSGKYNFGFSIYPVNKKLSYNLRGLGLEIKKNFKAQGTSARLVMSKMENLSSVTVAKNKLLGDKGTEVVFLEKDNSFMVGKTLAVQPFEKLSQRDYGRPQRDDLSGMIPPKLAQIMLNLARPEKHSRILDPFCGSGTILQEALLLGWENLFGADISAKAIAATRENIKWLKQKYNFDSARVRLLAVDIKNLPKYIETKADRIITEPWLGPPARGNRTSGQIKEIITGLTEVYTYAFQAFRQLLQPGGIVVIVFPVLTLGNKNFCLPLEQVVDQNIFQPQPALPVDLLTIYRHSERQTLIYSRPEQKVKRELMIFKYVK